MSDLLKDVSAGEWRVDGDGRDYSYLVGSNVCSIVSEQEQWLAECYGNSPEEALANAKLMAAAKDMADGITIFLSDFENERGEYFQKYVELFRAALKKAGAA